MELPWIKVNGIQFNKKYNERERVCIVEYKIKIDSQTDIWLSYGIIYAI